MYLALRTVLGFGLGVAVVSVVGSSLWLVSLPATYGFVHEDAFGVHVGSAGPAFAFVPLGLAGIVLSAWLVRGLGTLWARLAGMLAAPLETTAPRTEMQALLRRFLPAHAAFYGGLNVVLVIVWALTTRAYFWPVWTLMPLAMPLAIHAWTVFVDSGDPRRIARTRALAVDLGAAATLFLFLVGVWAVTRRGYFWPVWPGLGLAVVVGIHALSTMGTRIDVLTTTRAGAVGAAEAELRRIERDLHDGAQARLVAVGMSLGLAEQKLESDPRAARQLLAEARAGAGEALRDLRDLARGIHPPILADRGLEAALAALVGQVPLAVDLHVDLAERPPEQVESAAYFVVAEALANATKHAGASRIDIRVVRMGDSSSSRCSTTAAAAPTRRGRPARAPRPRRGARRDVPRREPTRRAHDRRGGAALRVVIAEDLALLRDGLMRLLRDNGFEVVAAVADGDALVHACSSRSRTSRSSTSGCRRRSGTRGCGRRSRRAGSGRGRRSSSSRSTSSTRTRRAPRRRPRRRRLSLE